MSGQLRDWINSLSKEERECFAAKAGTSVGYLWQLSGGHRKVSIELASSLCAASDGNLTLTGLRPDLEPFLKDAV